MKGCIVKLLAHAYGGSGTGVLVGGYLFVRRDGGVLIWREAEIRPSMIERLPIEAFIEASDLALADLKLKTDEAFDDLSILEVFDTADEADQPA